MQPWVGLKPLVVVLSAGLRGCRHGRVEPRQTLDNGASSLIVGSPEQIQVETLVCRRARRLDAAYGELQSDVCSDDMPIE